MSVIIRENLNTTSIKTSGDFKVRFFDFDGTILKEEWVDSGQTATAPTTPIHQYLTFAEWNNTFSGVTEDVDTGAIYNTTDGKTYYFITLTPLMVSGTTIEMFFNKNTSSISTIDWGDGTTTTTTTTGNTSIIKNYPSYGDYIVTISNPYGGTFTLGQPYTAQYGLFRNEPKCVTKCYFGNINYFLFGYSCFRSSSIKYISLCSGITNQALNLMFQDCYNLKHVNLPSAVMYQQQNFAYSTYNLEHFIYNTNFLTSSTYVTMFSSANYNLEFKKIPLGTTTGVYSNMYNNTILEIPSTSTSISNSAFANNYSILSYIFRPTTPPTLGTTVFSNINLLCKIYVPDESVTAYKTATGWIGVYDQYIYPISTYVR